MIVDLPSTDTSAVNRTMVDLRESAGAVALGRVLTLLIITEDGPEAEAAIQAANDASREQDEIFLQLRDAVGCGRPGAGPGEHRDRRGAHLPVLSGEQLDELGDAGVVADHQRGAGGVGQLAERRHGWLLTDRWAPGASSSNVAVPIG